MFRIEIEKDWSGTSNWQKVYFCLIHDSAKVVYNVKLLLLISRSYFFALASLVSDAALRKVKDTGHVKAVDDRLGFFNGHCTQDFINLVESARTESIAQLLTKALKHIPAQLQRTANFLYIKAFGARALEDKIIGWRPIWNIERDGLIGVLRDKLNLLSPATLSS